LYNPIPSQFLPTFGSNGTPSVPAPIQSWYLLIMNIFLFSILAWYFDHVLPDEFGNRHSPVFFLFPSYWGFDLKKKGTVQEEKDWMNKTIAQSQNVIPSITIESSIVLR
jgi:hypothetical protein